MRTRWAECLRARLGARPRAGRPGLTAHHRPAAEAAAERPAAFARP